MPSRLARCLSWGLATLVATTGAVVAAAPAAVAAPVFHAPFKPFLGDVTGDGIADRIALGSLTRANGTSVCAYQLAAGLGHGQFAAARTAGLPVRNGAPGDPLIACPDLGTVLKGPTPALNQLAATYFDLGPHDGPQVQVFTGFATGQVRFTGGFDGLYQASYIRSTDFDGDGFGDVYEGTDQGGPTELWVGRGSNWHELYHPSALVSSEQFLDLNGNGGTDVLSVSGLDYARDDTAAVVDGRSGAVQVLDGSPIPDDVLSRDFAISVIDIDHNRLPDLQLQTYLEYADGHTTATTTRFVNQSSGGRWYFKPTAL